MSRGPREVIGFTSRREVCHPLGVLRFSSRHALVVRYLAEPSFFCPFGHPRCVPGLPVGFAQRRSSFFFPTKATDPFDQRLRPPVWIPKLAGRPGAAEQHARSLQRTRAVRAVWA
jgi:hypothetical protein